MDKCYLCGRYTATDHHHIFNGAMRKKSEKHGAVVMVCRPCHERIHRDAELRLELKAEWQKILMERNGWSIEDFRKEFYKNYL